MPLPENTESQYFPFANTRSWPPLGARSRDVLVKFPKMADSNSYGTLCYLVLVLEQFDQGWVVRLVSILRYIPSCHI